MARFRHTRSGVVVSVDDSKTHRFDSRVWEPAEKPVTKAAQKRPTK